MSVCRLEPRRLLFDGALEPAWPRQTVVEAHRKKRNLLMFLENTASDSKKGHDARKPGYSVGRKT